MISVVVPCYNEEKNLPAVVDNIFEAARQAGGIAVEVLLINDASTDRTVEVIAELEKKHAHVRGFHHPENSGPGTCLWTGLAAAKHERLAYIPGDNMLAPYTLRNLFANAHRADFVAAYYLNTETRSRLRNVLSSIHSFVYVVTFNLHFRYINATPVCLVSHLRDLKLISRRYGVWAEIHTRLLRKGVSYVEVDGYYARSNAKSSALRIRNLTEVVSVYCRLWLEIFITSRKEYGQAPQRVIPE